MLQLEPRQRDKPRSRRLRKKLRVAEFQEFGFVVDIRFDPMSIDLDAVFDLWIDFVEAQGWSFGGGALEESQLSGFLCQAGRGGLGEPQRESVVKWAAVQPRLQLAVGPLLDAWHDEFT